MARRSFEGKAWHGPALWELLADVTAAEAAARPLTGVHSIAEIVRHLVATQDEVCRRLEGARARDLSGEQDWPSATSSGEAAWKKTGAELRRIHRRLRRLIRNFPSGRLDEVVPGRDHSFFATIHGIVEHDLYHAGQIAILKKVLRRKEKRR